MKIATAEFVRSAVDESGWPKDRLPQVAFVGRSNVGKSSLINSLLNRKGLVKTSGTPGKTREVNFFKINGDFYFADTPGFGYAKVPGKLQEGWAPMIEKYLRGSERLCLVVYLLDIRHEPGENDFMMEEWLRDTGVPTAHVATKADKIGRGSRAKNLRVITDALGLPAGAVLEYSATTGEGKNRLWDAIRTSIAAPPGA